jgi:hypothetical protein
LAYDFAKPKPSSSQPKPKPCPNITNCWVTDRFYCQTIYTPASPAVITSRSAREIELTHFEYCADKLIEREKAKGLGGKQDKR